MNRTERKTEKTLLKARNEDLDGVGKPHISISGNM
jgi:hypothetical protein